MSCFWGFMLAYLTLTAFLLAIIGILLLIAKLRQKDYSELKGIRHPLIVKITHKE